MNMADQEQRHFALLDSVPLGICVLRRDYTVCFWNTCLEDWTGLSRETIIGQDIGSFFPHLHEPKYRCRLETIFQGGARVAPSPAPNRACGTLALDPPPVNRTMRRLPCRRICSYATEHDQQVRQRCGIRRPAVGGWRRPTSQEHRTA